eukprot:PhF_6_TR6074/c0_g1_i1/m.8846
MNVLAARVAEYLSSCHHISFNDIPNRFQTYFPKEHHHTASLLLCALCESLPLGNLPTPPSDHLISILTVLCIHPQLLLTPPADGSFLLLNVDREAQICVISKNNNGNELPMQILRWVLLRIYLEIAPSSSLVTLQANSINVLQCIIPEKYRSLPCTQFLSLHREEVAALYDLLPKVGNTVTLSREEGANVFPLVLPSSSLPHHLYLCELLRHPQHMIPEFERPSVPKFELSAHALPIVEFPLMLIPQDIDTELSELITRAQKVRLTPDQSKQILRILLERPSSLFHCGLTTTTVPPLVEHNKDIAFQCLQRLCSTQYKNEFLNALVAMGVSEPSCDIVLRLVQSNLLPVEHLHKFILHGLKDLESRADAKGSHVRPMRIFCLLCHNLVISKVLVNSEVLVEVQHLCTVNATIPEVAQLYGVIRKTFDTQNKK